MLLGYLSFLSCVKDLISSVILLLCFFFFSLFFLLRSSSWEESRHSSDHWECYSTFSITKASLGLRRPPRTVGWTWHRKWETFWDFQSHHLISLILQDFQETCLSCSLTVRNKAAVMPNPLTEENCHVYNCENESSRGSIKCWFWKSMWRSQHHYCSKLAQSSWMNCTRLLS